MIKRLLLFILITYSFITDAQTIKTDVLVVGGSASGVAAAVQCARSKVKTVLATDGFKMSGATAGEQMVTLEMNSNIPSGIWGEFRKRVREVYAGTAGYDTTQ
ncbi:MAG: FAD-dependent oxidoreductase, partial [Bacteroidota bacterium]